MIVALRTAVVGSKLADVAEAATSYEEMKEEILTSRSQTPETIWRELISTSQG